MIRRNPSPPQPAAQAWQQHPVEVETDGQTQFQLPAAPAIDDSGDLLLRAELNGVTYTAPDDLSIDGNSVEWVSDVALAQGERLVFWFVPA